MTNGDAIRNMTDYELAEFMTAITKKSAEKLCGALMLVDVDMSKVKWELLTESNIKFLLMEVQE